MLVESLYVPSTMTDIGDIKYMRSRPCPYSQVGMKDTNINTSLSFSKYRDIHRSRTKKKEHC